MENFLFYLLPKSIFSRPSSPPIQLDQGVEQDPQPAPAPSSESSGLIPTAPCPKTVPQEELWNLSHLRDESEEISLPLSAEDIKKLFYNKTFSPAERASSWLPLLSAWPQIDSLKQAFSSYDSISKEIDNKNFKQTKEILKTISIKTVGNITQLKPQESIVLVGGTPYKPPHLDKVFGSFYTNLIDPEKIKEPLKKWSDSLISFLKNASKDLQTSGQASLTVPGLKKEQEQIPLHVPKELLQMRQVMGEIFDKGALAVFCPILTQSLLENKSLPKKIALSPLELGRRIAQEFIEESLDEWRAPLESLKDSWLSKEVQENLLKALKEDRLEEEMQSIFLSWAANSHELLRKAFFQTLQGVTEGVPPYLKILLTLSGYGNMGEAETQILLQIIKEEKGTFRLRVFGEGEALNWHPQEVKNGQRNVTLPLEFNNLTDKDLDSDFFLRFFSYQFYPRKNSAIVYSSAQFYENLLGSLSQKPLADTPKISYDPSASAFDHFIAETVFHQDTIEQTRFYFYKRLHALMHGFKQEYDSFLLKDLALLLNQETQELLNKNILSFEESLKIYATTTEILNSLNANFPKKEKKQKLIPLELKSKLQALLYTEEASLIEELLELALGPEVKELIADVKDEVGKPPITLDVNSSIPSFSLKVIAETVFRETKREVTYLVQQFVGLSMRDIQRPNTLSYVKIAFLVVRVALVIFFPGAGLTLHFRWTVSIIAKRSLVSLANFFLPEVTRKLALIEKKFYVRLILPLLLNESVRAHFQGVVDLCQAFLFQKKPLSFSIRPHEIKPIKPTSSKIVRKTHTLFLERSKQPIDEERPLLLRVKPHLFSPQTIDDTLQEWLAQSNLDLKKDGLILHDLFIFLNETLKQLPLPSHAEDNFWRQVPNPSSCLKNLTQLALYLSRAKTGDSSTEQRIKGQINLFKIYAIVDVLARQIPGSHLQGYKPNGWILASWAHSLAYQFVDLDLHSQLQEIERYLDIDPRKIYTQKELDNLASTTRTLFYRSPSESGVDPLYYGSPEKDYYIDLLQDPEIIQKLEKRGIEQQTPLIVKLSTLYTDELKDGERLLPFPFFCLRFLNMLAHCAIHPSDDRRLPMSIEKFSISQYGYRNVIQEVVSFTTLGLLSSENSVSPGSFWIKLPNTYNNLQNPFPCPPYEGQFNELGTFRSRIIGSHLSLPPRCQNDVVEDPPSLGFPRSSQSKLDETLTWIKKNMKNNPLFLFTNHVSVKNHPIVFDFGRLFPQKSPIDPHFLSALSEKERMHLEMLFTNPEDRVASTLSYFSRNISLLKKTEGIQLLTWLLLQGDALYSQLKKTPHFANSLGAFFKEISFLLEENFPLIELGILVKARVRLTAPEFCSSFPNFNLYSGSVRLQLLPFFFLDPAEATVEEKKQAVFAICRSLSFPKNGVNKDDLPFIVDTYLKWKAALADLLDQDLDLRNRVFNLHSNLPGKTSWEGAFPFYHVGSFSCHFNDALKKPLFLKSSQIELQKEAQDYLLSQIYGAPPPPSSAADFKFITSTSSSEMTLQVKRLFEGKWYTWIEPPSLEKIGEENQEPVPLTYWIEFRTRSILVFKGDHLVSQTHSIDSSEKDPTKDLVPLSLVKHDLDSLAWFQPLSSIYITYFPDTNQIRHIAFNDLFLTFDVKEIEGKKRACGRGNLSSFYIAELQGGKNLSFSSFLLLTNQQGQEKIVVPTKSLMTSTLSWVLEYTSNFKTSQWMDARLTTLIKDLETPLEALELPPYFVYDLDSEDNPTTADFEALFYLVTQSLREKDLSQTRQYLRAFESLAKLKFCPSSLKSLVTLLNALAASQSSPILVEASLRLTAALIENEALQNPSNNNKDLKKTIFDSSQFLCLMATYSFYLERKENYLDEYQELFLLNFLSKHGSTLLEKSNLLDDSVPNYAKECLSSLSDILVMPSQMYDRYFFLLRSHTLPGEKEEGLFKLAIHHLLFEKKEEGEGGARCTDPLVSSIFTHVKKHQVGHKSAHMGNIFFLLDAPVSLNLEEADIPVSLSTLNAEKIQSYFLFYYAVAIREKHSPAALRALTLLDPADFKEKDGVADLVAGLKIALNKKGVGFPPAHKLQAILIDHRQKQSTPGSNPDPSKDFLTWTMTYKLQLEKAQKLDLIPFQALWDAAKNYVLKGSLLMLSSRINPSAALFYKGVETFKTGYKVFEGIKTLNEKKREASERALVRSNGVSPLPADLGDRLHQLDASISLFLRNLIDPFLKPTEKPSPLMLPAVATENPIDAYAFEKLQKSLHIYANLSPKPQITLDPSDIAPLTKQLEAFIFNNQKRVFLLQKEIFTLIKPVSLPQSSNELSFLLLHPPFLKQQVPFEEILYLFAEDKLHSLVEKIGIDPEALPLLEEKVFDYLVLSSRLKHVERCKNLLKKAAHGLDAALLSQIQAEFCQHRSYAFNDPHTPQKLLKCLLVFEERRNMLLWDIQTKQLKASLNPDTIRSLVQLPTGSGKTDVLAVLLNQLQSRPLITVFPASLAADNTSQMSLVSKIAFGKMLRSFHFSRLNPPNADTLWTVLRCLEQGIEGGVGPVITKEEMQSLELLFLEELHDYQEGSSNTKIPLYKSILRLLRERYFPNVDEGHQQFRIDVELNHPSGEPQLLDRNSIDLMSNVLFIIFKEGKFEGRSLVHFFKTHLHIDPSQESSFEHYLLDKTTPIPMWVLDHPARDEIALLRGLIHVLLPECLSATIGVNFGLSKEKRDPPEYAIPYGGNDTPIEGATIKNPFEAFLKTCLVYLHQKLSSSQVERMIDKLKSLAQKESDQTGCPFSNTLGGRYFSLWTNGQFDLSNADLPLDEITHLFNTRPGAILSFVRMFVAKKITYFPKNFRSDSSNFASMGQGFVSSSASPPLDSTLLPENTELFLHEETEGAFASRICETTPPEGVFSLKGKQPSHVLEEVAAFVAGHENVFAVIDSGALFCGISHRQVATDLLKAVHRQRPTIKGIVFFNEENHLKILLPDGEEEDYHLASLKEGEYITYFDQAHTFGSNVKHPFSSQGIVLVGDQLSFDDLMQGGGRMRKLRESHGQSLIFALSPKIANVSIPAELVAFTQKQNAASHAKNYLPSLKQQIDNIPRRAVLDKILWADTTKKSVKILKAFENLLIGHTKLNTFEMFAVVPYDVSPQEALSTLKRQAFEKIQNSSFFSYQEKEGIKHALDKIGQGRPAPLKVCFTPPSVPQTGIAQKTNLTVEQKNHVHKEEEQEQQVQLQLQNQSLNGSKKALPPLREKAARWEPSHISLSSHATMPPLKPKPHELVEIYEIGLSLKQDPNFTKVAPAFKGLYWTNNLRGITSRGDLAPLFSRIHKPILQLLIIRNTKTSDIKSVAIDQNDSAQLKEYLKQNREGKNQFSDMEIGIFDLTLQTVIDNGCQPLQTEKLLSDKTFRQDLIRFKFLSGATRYTSLNPDRLSENKENLDFLGQWLKAHEIDAMSSLFQTLYAHQGTEDMEHSDIQFFFDRNQRFLGEIF